MNHGEKKPIAQWAFITPTIGSLVFLIFTTIAMFFYKGGTAFNPDLNRYDFFHNFFSDLGRTYVYDGESNSISSTLFISAAVISGILLIPYYINLSKIPFGTEKKQKYARFATRISLISSPAFVAVGLIPSNINTDMHMLAVNIAFMGTGIIIIIYGILFLNHENYPRISGKLFLLYSVLLLIYIFVMIIFLDPNQGNAFLIQVLSQKIIVYTNIIVMSTQGILGYQWSSKIISDN